MDKVIIDRVDVSGCDSYTSNYREPMPYGEIKVTKHYCWHINSNCDGKDCDFKQIKRLEQENEQIKKDYAKLHIDFAKCNEENERLKEESKELKSSLVSQASIIFTLEKSSNDLSQGINKLYQALQEIREIILSPEIIDEETKKLHTSEELDNIVRWHREDKLSKIKAKINEVIGAEK